MTEKQVKKAKARNVVGPKLKKLLFVVLGGFGLMAVNSTYLVGVTIAGAEYQNWFYLNMFLMHLVVGLLLVAPVLIFAGVHIRNAYNRRNKRAINVGYVLFAVILILFISGIILTRVDLFGFRFEVNDAGTRSLAYWGHVLSPLFIIWLFVLHRLAGKRIKWKIGARIAVVALLFAGIMLFWQTQDPRKWNQEGPESGEQYFFPSLARTSTGNFIPPEVLDNDQYCKDCHADIHDQWLHSVHRLSSFNNPAYLFSVKETRRDLMNRDGNVHASRFCAGCHDPVPFFGGAFDDPKFDDPNYDLASDPSAQAGITCTVCHSISHVNSVRGNADYTIDEPQHYPFAFSQNEFLKWVNHQLVKAKPEFHKATFLKPLHQSAEYCGSCHKVHLPPELNHYKWLRGQNHYDSFFLSGVSGQGITSFYYPPKAQSNCNGCHMPLEEVSDLPNFGAEVRDDSGLVKTMNHQFPSANTALPHMLADSLPDAEKAIEAHREFLKGSVRVDFFGIKEDGRIDGALTAPLRPNIPKLEPGRSYLLETVVRTMTLGHLLTQGTVDSNQLWLEMSLWDGDRLIGSSGHLNEDGAEVDPWSHFINAFVVDREGNRIDRRNAEDIFTAVYNNQIPPGAADTVHYRFTLPADVKGPIRVKARLRYRKFDTFYMRLVNNDPTWVNDLPIVDIAEDEIVFPLDQSVTGVAEPDHPLWQRWNDYGIGLFRKGRLGELSQAAVAFAEVEKLGRPEGPVNLARVYIKEGLVQSDAPEALARAANMDAYAWSLLWFGAQVAESNGDYLDAARKLEDILRGRFPQAEGRNFDFSKDYRLLNTLGNVYYQLGLRLRGDERVGYMKKAEETYQSALALDPENAQTHWGLKRVYGDLGNAELEALHEEKHAYYKPDDNAREEAVSKARLKYPAADHAAEDVVIYDLQRDQTAPQ